MKLLIFLDTGIVGKLIHPLVPNDALFFLNSNNSDEKQSSVLKKSRAIEEMTESIECIAWLKHLLDNRSCVVGMSEVADYENRREHIRRIYSKKSSPEQKQNALKAIQKLDILKTSKRIGFFPVNLEEGDVMIKAAELWACARNNADNIFDADVIIAAQSVIIKSMGIGVVVATTDASDFNRLLKLEQIPARRWRDIII